VTSHGQVARHRRSRRSVPIAGAGAAVAAAFAMGAAAQVFLMGGGWYEILEDVLYPLAFVFSLAGSFSGGFLLISAEHEGDQRRAWRAFAVFIASTIFAALLFWVAV
jgi:hypothetical protein